LPADWCKEGGAAAACERKKGPGCMSGAFCSIRMEGNRRTRSKMEPCAELHADVTVGYQVIAADDKDADILCDHELNSTAR